MKRITNLVLAAILVCGTSVFTSCSNDDESPVLVQGGQNRKEFIDHTRATVKDLAENLNFFSWTSASLINQLIKSEMTCKGVNQTIPMQLVTTKFGVDWWTMPALKFSDENSYVPLTDMLDEETVTYGFNILDHAVEPMQQSIIVVRQLLQYVNTLFGAYEIPTEK